MSQAREDLPQEALFELITELIQELTEKKGWLERGHREGFSAEVLRWEGTQNLSEAVKQPI